MNSRITNFDLAWFDDFNLLRQYVSTNPPKSRLIRYERLLQPRASTYEACYLREAVEEDADASLAAYERAIKNNPNDAYAYYNRAVVKQERLNDYPGAAQDFNKAISLDPYLELSFQSRGSVADQADVDPKKYTLVSFFNGDKLTWLNYEKCHYLIAATEDLESPIMQNVFQTHMHSLTRA
jgi:tetratricopeptide (TPR) repeat protein